MITAHPDRKRGRSRDIIAENLKDFDPPSDAVTHSQCECSAGYTQFHVSAKVLLPLDTIHFLNTGETGVCVPPEGPCGSAKSFKLNRRATDLKKSPIESGILIIIIRNKSVL